MHLQTGTFYFYGVFDKNGTYTGHARPIVQDTNIMCFQSYNTVCIVHYYNFPQDFIPKKDAIYKCNAEMTDTWREYDRGTEKEYTRVLLNSPIEVDLDDDDIRDFISAFNRTWLDRFLNNRISNRYWDTNMNMPKK